MRSRAFTLVELLVVISIISLLASVVMASLNSAREKGRLAAGKQFENNVYHAAADQAVSLLDFDDCSGASATDRSGNGNAGAITGMTPTWSSDTPSGTGCSLSFDGVGGYVNEGNASSVNVAGPLTVSAWIKLSDLSAHSILSKWGAVASANYSWLLFSNFWGSGRVDFLVSGNGTSYAGASSPNGAVSVGKWHFIAGVYDGSSAKLFIDGALVATNTSVPSSLSVSATPVTVGADFDSGGSLYRVFKGLIDDARVFSKALTAMDVRGMYLAGLPSHFAAK